jgi:DNA ligase-1
MNSSSVCHEIPDCPRLFVDAFRGAYLQKTRNPDNVFILSHWHGDHYGSLPRDGKYQGPSLIHCTPTTAALLREIHQVPEKYVVEHGYGETWLFHPLGNTKGLSTVQITFYDANHCPGAAIIVVEMADGKVHLHTGDMRYHTMMNVYPILERAASSRAIDTVLLDTTYSDPKHNFQPQEAAIDAIAAYSEGLLGTSRKCSSNVLILLSCYSIGKEKVLWEVSSRTNQLVYVNDRKMRMMRCIQKHHESSSQIVQRCTTDPNATDIHVIPMGLAGELWPYFQPNYWACAEYAKALETEYTKVVAFIPTGWADGSKWNKKNATSKFDCKGIEVEIRLISYSEHSSFSELKTFVEFLRPRKVVPTVFKDDRDRVKIEGRFAIDSGRAKQSFFSTMTSKSSNIGKQVLPGAATRLDPFPKRPKLNMSRSSPLKQKEGHVEKLASMRLMGFSADAANGALVESKGNIEEAVGLLITGKTKLPPTAEVIDLSGTNDVVESKSVPATPCEKQYTKSSTELKKITNFFAKKENNS